MRAAFDFDVNFVRENNEFERENLCQFMDNFKKTTSWEFTKSGKVIALLWRKNARIFFKNQMEVHDILVLNKQLFVK